MKEDKEQLNSVQEASLTVIEQQERANIDMLVATAKRYPRDLVRVKRAMESMACLDEETAESCNYHLERDGHSIDGPSVRMAEIAVACYQNIRAGSRVVSNDGKTIVGQAFCHDMENNVFIAWETPRRITNKQGKTFSEDMQVTTGNAAAAIAFRNAVLKVIPAALVKPVADKARQVAFGDLKTLSYRRTRAFKSFASIGVKEDRVLAYLKKASTGDVDVADVEKLYGVFTAIKEGSTTIEETFPPSPLPMRPAAFKKEKADDPSVANAVPSSPESKPAPSDPVDEQPDADVQRPAGIVDDLSALLAKEKVTTTEVITALIEHAQPVGDATETGSLADLPDETIKKAIKQFGRLAFTIHKNRQKAASQGPSADDVDDLVV
jgi:hypothetical protein